MIRVRNLTKEFGEIRAIDGLSFEVAEGEILGFLGPNGAGKTTTMRVLTCVFPPTAGQATVGGFDVVEDPHAVRRVIGYLPEGVPLYREMTVESALDFVAHAKGIPRAQRPASIAAAIEETNLGEVRRRLIGHLSKGFRQRVGLAQALIGDPKVLILDEPTVGLDPKQIAEVRNLIRGMAGRRTVILSTHILPEVQMTCSRVLIINRGRIAASGTTEKLTTQMRTDSRLELVIAGPPGAVSSALKAVPGTFDLDHTGDPHDESRERIETYRLSARTVAAVVSPIVAETIVRNGWRLLEMRSIGMTLEDLFLEIVAGETAEQDPDMDAPSEPEAATA